MLVGSGVVKVLNVVFVVWGYSGVTMSDVIQKNNPSGGDIVATVYYAPWCPFCKKLLENLDRTDTPYSLIDVDQSDEASRWVESVNDGNRIVPTVRFSDGSTATNPSAGEVRRTIDELSA